MSLVSELVEVLSLAVRGIKVANLVGIELRGDVREVGDVRSADVVLCDSELASRGSFLDSLGRDLDSSSIALIIDLGIEIYRRPSLPKDLAERGLGLAFILSGFGMGLVYRRGYDDKFASRALEVYRDSLRKGPVPVDVNTAKALYALTKFIAYRRKGKVVEVGAGLGFSTMFLAHACAEAKTELISIEVREDRASYVSKALESVGLSKVANVVVGDAKTVDYGSKDVTLAFIDGKKEEYHEYLRNLENFLAPQATLLAHNTLSHPHLVANYLARVYGESYRSITIAVDPDGLTISIKLA